MKVNASAFEIISETGEVSVNGQNLAKSSDLASKADVSALATKAETSVMISEDRKVRMFSYFMGA